MKYLFKNLHELLITAFSKKHQFISDTKIKAKNFEAVVLGWAFHLCLMFTPFGIVKAI